MFSNKDDSVNHSLDLALVDRKTAPVRRTSSSVAPQSSQRVCRAQRCTSRLLWTPKSSALSPLAQRAGHLDPVVSRHGDADQQPDHRQQEVQHFLPLAEPWVCRASARPSPPPVISSSTTAPGSRRCSDRRSSASTASRGEQAAAVGAGVAQHRGYGGHQRQRREEPPGQREGWWVRWA